MLQAAPGHLGDVGQSDVESSLRRSYRAFRQRDGDRVSTPGRTRRALPRVTLGGRSSCSGATEGSTHRRPVGRFGRSRAAEQLRPQDVRVTGIERQHGGTIGGLSYGSLPLVSCQLPPIASSIPVRTFSHVEACAACCRGHRRECPWSVAELSRADRGFRRAWTARSVASITSCSRKPWPPPFGTVDPELRHAVTPSVSSTSDLSTLLASSGSSGIASPSAHRPIAIRPANEIALTRSAWCGAISASE